MSYFLDFGADDSICMQELHAWAVQKIKSSLTGFKAFFVTDADVVKVIGAAGSAEFARLVEAAAKSQDAFIAELRTRTTLEDSDVAGVVKSYSEIAARARACFYLAPGIDTTQALSPDEQSSTIAPPKSEPGPTGFGLGAFLLFGLAAYLFVTKK